MKQTKTHTKPDKKTCKSMLDPANSVTVEKGSTMRQKFNSSNTSPRGRIKKKNNKNARDEQHRKLLTPQVYRCSGQCI